jgi:hypothetical protein
MRRITLTALAIGATVLSTSAAWSGQYPAWGDTGWVYVSKRECCNAAIAIAQEQSAAACVNSGSEVRPMRGGVRRRGSCTWQSNRDTSGVTVFRCRAEATVSCR